MYFIDLANLPDGFQYFTFSGGEPHMEVPTIEGDVYIEAIINDWETFGKLLLLLNCINNQSLVTAVHLYIPYFPGARQDRNPGGNTPLTVAVYANAIADNLTRHIEDTWLYTFDIHSDAALRILGDAMSPFIGGQDPINLQVDRLDGSEFDDSIDLIIAPDEGAVGRATCFRDTHFPTIPVVYAEKVRDFETREIKGFKLPPLPAHRKALIVDDICDGGRTFNEVAKAWEMQTSIFSHPIELQLYISHAIFSRGTKNIHPLIQRIYTTRSHSFDASDDVAPPRLTIVTLPEPEIANV